MNKLITVTLRWMHRDKKRTLLSFVSIVMAMYLLMFVGVYFSSFVSLMRSEIRYDEGGAHAEIDIDGPDTGDRIIRNASVSEGAYFVNYGGLFYHDFLLRYSTSSQGGDNNYLPMIWLNGTSVAEVNDGIYNASLTAGDLPQLCDTDSYDIRGRMPKSSGEILLDSGVADLFGAELGKPFTVRYEVRKCRLEYIVQDIPKTLISENAFEKEYAYDEENAVWRNTDENGQPVYAAAEGGKYMNMIWTMFSDNSSELNSAINELLGGTYQYEDDLRKDRLSRYTFRAVLSDEPAEVVENTFTVVGIAAPGPNLSQLVFYSGDEWARQQVSGLDVWNRQAYVRIKEGMDIDKEVRQICDSVGILPMETLPDGHVVEHIYYNDDLIFLEGRDFGRAGNAMLMFIVMIAVVFIFVFFARLIINNAFELSSAYRMEQYGAIKTVGASNRQVFAMVFIECMIYMLPALPIAIGLALLTGRLIMNGIMSIRIFDLQYGPGISERFFSLEIIPVIFVTAVFVAIFSVVFSGYACAIRIKKLSPIAAVTAGKKQKPPRRRSHLIRKLFGFSVGYAARSAGRNKMRGFITVLAAVVSGTLVFTITALLYAIDRQELFESGAGYDYLVCINTRDADAGEEYHRLEDSGVFTKVEPSFFNTYNTMLFWQHTSSVPETLRPALTEEYIKAYEQGSSALDSLYFCIRPVTRGQLEGLTADADYDEVLSGGGILLCNDSRDGSPAAFKEGLTEVTVPLEGLNTAVKIDVTLPVAGYFSGSTQFGSSANMVTAAVPIERFTQLRHELNQRLIQKDPNAVSFNDLVGFELYIGYTDEDADRALAYLNSGSYDIIGDNVSLQQTAKRVSAALKIAGLSLAAVVFAVALVNIISTSAANIVNRRRELSMLRACGMSMRQVTLSLTVSSLFCAVITSVLSTAAGSVLATLVYSLMGAEEMPALPWFASVLIGVLVFTVMQGSYLLPLRSMSRSPIAEEVRSKE